MPVTLNANSSTGFIATSDTSGVLQLQTGGTTAVTVDASQNVTLAGTLTATGVTTVPAGTVSAPAITTTGDTNTGIFFPAADTIAFSEGGVESMRIDSSGNVGIGTSSPSALLHVRKDQTAATYIMADNLGTVNAATSSGFACAEGGSVTAFFRSLRDATGIAQLFNTSASPLTFGTNNTERARIDSSGNLLVGTTSLLSGAERFALSSSAADWTQVTRSSNASPFGMLINYSAATPNGTGNAFISCYDNNVGNQRFTVRSNGGIANYTANNSPLSDRRLKKNITPAGSYLDKICAIPVVTYFYNDQTDDLPNLGVIAQDVQLAAPELCNEEGWGTKAEDGSTYLGIWETDIQYALMKSIQELKALVDAQASTITQLQADVAALKGASA